MNANKVLFNPFNPEFHANPYPLFDRLRQEDPIHKSIFGTWIITRYADAVSILNDKRFHVDNLPKRLQLKSAYLKEGDLQTLSQTIDQWLFFLNPPDHTRLKRVVTPAFSPTAVEAIRQKIQVIVDDLLAKVKQKGEMDIITDLANPLSALTITEIFGLPKEDYEKLIYWSSEEIFILEQPRSLEDYQHQNQVIIENKEYLVEKVAECKKQPHDGLISYLINQKNLENQLTEDEIISTCMLISTAAQETTSSLIGNGILALLNHPESLVYLQHNPKEIKNAVEEFVRYDSPIQSVARRPVEDVEMAGKIIPSGDTVIVHIGAANRDPQEFTNPHQLNFARQNRHIAFGGGIHHCLGIFLAKIEAQIAINTVIQSLSDIRINTDKLDWHESISLRGLKTLPVKFTNVYS
ncbi:cytochrome P450 [Dolichospermum circinale]|uniref:cytochrome P450 n=1 Tax=Dolichospermum circinale TaxID=109265 RepID=UPI00232B4343|nr:cytochrome P450 [Dolichospermum circinale]MDB9468879.1 cytochrome P450 [Dolichospermum circinale CS-539/09]MDB9469943.1 cytochrome P450 [Dolichospermum circinale CS-539]